MTAAISHDHTGSACPVQTHKHAFCPPQAGDSRSVCPALNAMANHGYIPRNGKNISIPTLIAAARHVFGLSLIFATVLVITTMLSVGKLWTADLFDLGRHGRIEHDASLVHGDTPHGMKYAPTKVHPELVEALVQDGGKVVDKVDFARMRVRREKTSPKLGALHAEIARGEAALLLGVLSTAVKGGGIELDVLVSLLGEERIPEGWRPDHTQGLVRTVLMSREIKAVMEDMRRGAA